ncbi:hypothetical protein B0F90DRAFT_1927656 [Multifurca ochricompacta]|uniref:TNase-like domain-containing protein n=1 Tax=Multifurca ochricompacta TaxID=376703 RepID=A0AAD4M0M3_9AGAM|nr:hypothetical protein B0F90DRAFT_1927656 [Multifurca ochricompacta]
MICKPTNVSFTSISTGGSFASTCGGSSLLAADLVNPDAQKPNRRKRASSADTHNPTAQVETNVLIALAFILGSATTLGTSAIYRRFFKRIRNAHWVTPNLLKRKRWITGVVTSVGDADNFRLYHTPGFGWRGPFKFRHIPTGIRKLSGKTIHIRMAGIDAPELSHFNRPAQPYSAEALAWLKENIEGRRIKCQLLQRDRFHRVVGVPLLPRRRWWRLWPRNLSLEMVRAGWAVVYEQAGAEYGEVGKDPYLLAQAEAQSARKGIWQGGTDIETPAEYKKRYRTAEEARIEEELDAPEPEGDPENKASSRF